MWYFISNDQMKMNLRVNEHIYVMTRFKRRRVQSEKNIPSVFFRERGRNVQFTIGGNHLMTSG